MKMSVNNLQTCMAKVTKCEELEIVITWGNILNFFANVILIVQFPRK